MSRPLKKPSYNKQKITQELLDRIAEAFGVPYDDRDCVGEHKPSLREIAEEFGIAPIRMRNELYCIERDRIWYRIFKVSWFSWS